MQDERMRVGRLVVGYSASYPFVLSSFLRLGALNTQIPRTESDCVEPIRVIEPPWRIVGSEWLYSLSLDGSSFWMFTVAKSISCEAVRTGSLGYL